MKKPLEAFDEQPTSLHLADFTFLTANLVLDMDKTGANPFYVSAGHCHSGGFFTLAKLQVPDGMAYGFGTRNQKIALNCRMDASGGEMEGFFKVIGTHPTGTPMVDLGTFSTRSMDSSAIRSITANPTPKFEPPWILNKGFLLVAFKPEVDDQTLVYNDADNILNIPIIKCLGRTRRVMGR